MNRSFSISAIALALLSTAVLPAQAAITATAFVMVPSAAAKTCLPKAAATVFDVTHGPSEELTVSVSHLPAKTVFTLFATQVPNSPFGPSMYLGDIVTDASGAANGQFIGRFSRGTFMVSPGVAPAPQTFTKGQFPDAKQGVKVGPVQLYHLGLWFNTPAAAARAHCANTVTPFNIGHNAGIQVLNTGLYPKEKGPLQMLNSGS